MSFYKYSSFDLNETIVNLGNSWKKQQDVLTQIIANVVYQSIHGNNADMGLKLVKALKGNGYHRTNDVLTYLCKMGNFKHNKEKGLHFAPIHPKELALEIAELCVENPMFSIVKEQQVKTEIDALEMFEKTLAAIRHQIKKAANEGRELNVKHGEAIQAFSSTIAQLKGA